MYIDNDHGGRGVMIMVIMAVVMIIMMMVMFVRWWQ